MVKISAFDDKLKYDHPEDEPTTDDNISIPDIECKSEIESACITESGRMPAEMSLTAHRETTSELSPDPRTNSREQYVYSKRGDGNHAHYHMLSRKGNRKQQLAAARKRRKIEGGPGQ